MEVIYQSEAEAIEAIKKYYAALDQLSQNTGVWEENHDSCSGTSAYAKYFDSETQAVKIVSGDYL